MVEDNAGGVAALGDCIVVAPVLATVSEHAASAVLVVADVAQLTLAAGAHHAAHSCTVTHLEVALCILAHLRHNAHNLVPAIAPTTCQQASQFMCNPLAAVRVI